MPPSVQLMPFTQGRHTCHIWMHAFTSETVISSYSHGSVTLSSLLQKRASKNRNRFLLLFGFALFGLFGAQQIKIGGTGLVGAGALSVLVVAFVAHLRWKKDPSTSLLRRGLLMLWLFVQPFLFGLIGAAVDVYSIDPQNIGVFVCV